MVKFGQKCVQLFLKVQNRSSVVGRVQIQRIFDPFGALDIEDLDKNVRSVRNLFESFVKARGNSEKLQLNWASNNLENGLNVRGKEEGVQRRKLRKIVEVSWRIRGVLALSNSQNCYHGSRDLVANCRQLQPTIACAKLSICNSTIQVYNVFLVCGPRSCQRIECGPFLNFQVSHSKGTLVCLPNIFCGKRIVEEGCQCSGKKEPKNNA